MKIAIQYTMNVLLKYNCALYYCIPGVVLMCRVKIHKIVTCSLGVSKCQMLNFR